MPQKPFIGRKSELAQLKAIYDKGMANLVVVKGRRRIGKSRLIAEFSTRNSGARLWSFAGLAPQAGMTGQTQRDHFARQLMSFINMPPLTFQDWTDAFNHLSRVIQNGDIILLDEISWMSDKDPTFISKLKAWWDEQNIHVLLVICSSVSIWVEENILKNTALFGRVSLTITLEPLSISESASLLTEMGYKASVYDTYKLMSIFGGVPWYLEQAAKGVMADDIIKGLCFQKDGLLVLEFDRIFHDLFNGRGAVYKKILGVLKEGMKSLAEIRVKTEFAHSGTLSEMMGHLITAGFVKKQNLWSFKTLKPLKQSLYRIADPYLRFYLKVIEPNLNKIELGAFEELSLSSMPAFDAHMGLQLEYLLLQNRKLLLKAIGIMPSDVVCDGPYRQSKTTKTVGCQIDYLVQTLTKNLFVCEFKFKRKEIGREICSEVLEKAQALKVPRGYSTVPVLFHLSGVSASVELEGDFYRVIDIGDFLIPN